MWAVEKVVRTALKMVGKMVELKAVLKAVGWVGSMGLLMVAVKVAKKAALKVDYWAVRRAQQRAERMVEYSVEKKAA